MSRIEIIACDYHLPPIDMRDMRTKGIISYIMGFIIEPQDLTYNRVNDGAILSSKVDIYFVGYGTNDWIDNALFSYDGNSVTEVARFIGWAYIDSYGKMISTNNVDGNVTARIADPFITRSYYEFHNGKLEEISMPIKDKTYTFSDSYANFNFYETPDAPTEEFAHELISSFRNSDEFKIIDYYDRDFAGKRFTILDHSVLEVSYRGAWYFVLLEDGRKGIIHWWLAM